MKLVLPLDNEIFFDAAEPTTAMADKEEFLRYMKSTSNVSLSREEIKKGLCAILSNDTLWGEPHNNIGLPKDYTQLH